MLSHTCNLSDITYCGIDGRINLKLIQLMVLSAEFAAKYITFNKIIILTPRDNHIKHDFIEFIHIDPLYSTTEYNRFCIQQLYRYINSHFCLVFQYDGCISNPHLWDYAFLSYDYIGAPWPLATSSWIAPTHLFKEIGVVGNGGFSLRSAKLLHLCKSMPYNNFTNEDIAITITHRQFLMNHGIRFADYQIGKKFSIEYACEPDHNFETSFGFHARHNLVKFIDKL